ncbi:GDSL family lipase [Nocardiopsis algeriensis]|uniref:Lysophospholipase L1-like esterase n=1 Tax=Nocardiopsis algeriensis TaxID=1478215 RepID=A0A841IKX7_9ACTN|nr:lysophospholipase L1-like esterase [Nocardiopsis algeriensis]
MRDPSETDASAASGGGGDDPCPEALPRRARLLRALRSRAARALTPLRDLTWQDLSPRSVVGRGLARWRHRSPRPRSSRFEPGPFGLFGVMLAAMAATLLIIQVSAGGPGGAEDELVDEPVTIPGPPPGELRIMVVGDALTQGSSGDSTWRYHLWKHLEESGVEFDLVGPREGVHPLEGEKEDDAVYADPDFDTDHAALWGLTAQEMSTGTAQVAAEHGPQYLLLLAGMEDILDGGDADLALDGVGETISTVRVVQGETRFVVGELPQAEGTGDDERVNTEIARFNMGLVELAQQVTSADSPVVVARVADGYSPVRDNWEGVHPNARGQVRIAAAFADALARPLQVGEPYPRPLPEVDVGPRREPEPEAEETEDGLRLSWPGVPGATAFRVSQRRVEPDPDEETVLPLEPVRDGDGWSALVEGLFSGAEYEFTVTAFKGRDEGASSEPLRLVWDGDPPPGPEGLRSAGDGVALVWDEVGEATHYEVWVRPLECSAGDDRRAPAEPDDGTGSPDPGEPTAPVGPPEGEPTPSPEPRPEPEPEPALPEPPAGAVCGPQDGLGPDEGEGWLLVGPVEGTRWEVSVPERYEVAVRSYRDYVKGGYSASFPLTDR